MIPAQLSTLDFDAGTVAPRPQATAPGPFLPDGPFTYGYYDAVAFSTGRQARPYFVADSRQTLTSWSRLRAMALSRWAYINVPVVKAAVDLMARLTVGTGFAPSTPGPLGKLYDSYYVAKTRNIGFMAGESMDELLLHDCRAVDVDGDLGYALTADETGAEKLQLIEGHRIQSGTLRDDHLVDGVWIDAYARRTAFNVVLPGDEQKTQRIEARDFIYLAERNRPDELRSMTNLVHALNPLQDLYEIIQFATTSAKKNSEIAAVIETLTPNDLPLGGPRGMTVKAAVPANGGQPAVPAQTITYEQVYGGGGKIPVLRPGEKFVSYAHGHPAPTIEAWSQFIIRGIAAGYGLPFEILWNPEQIGGANTRLITGLLRARLAQRRAQLIFPKLSRTRFWLLAKAIARGDLPYDPALFRVEWQPKFIDITVDAGREASQRRANVVGGLDTYTGFSAEQGTSYLDTLLPEREAEMAAQCAAAQRLVDKYPALSFEAALARIALLTAGASEGTLNQNSGNRAVAGNPTA
jgi:hypothetical protein